jgi:hypothetical protein
MTAAKLEQFEEFEELNYLPQPVGPSSRSCCKVTVGNVCGSGSIVGERNGKTLVMTNAHVAGTQIGRRVNCLFPFLNNTTVGARIIVAAYSDRVMMDWAVLECDSKVDLPIVKLSQKAPTGDHYTAGYPRCQGPRFQRLVTRSFQNNGTVWRWQPNSIGGQSGSGVHSLTDNLQRGVLTWSWGGDGAGQTTRSIWMQYAQRAEIGFPRHPDLIELADERSETENGFHFEANITTLPIWAELENDPRPDEPVPDDPVNPSVVQEILASSSRLRAEADRLAELARKYGAKPESDPGRVEPPSGGTFGL